MYNFPLSMLVPDVGSLIGEPKHVANKLQFSFLCTYRAFLFIIYLYQQIYIYIYKY